MKNLIDDMTNQRPADRPRIEEVIQRFTDIRKSLSNIKLRSALTSQSMPRIICAAQEARQHVRTIRYIFLRKAAIPNP